MYTPLKRTYEVLDHYLKVSRNYVFISTNENIWHIGRYISDMSNIEGYRYDMSYRKSVKGKIEEISPIFQQSIGKYRYIVEISSVLITCV